MTNTAKMNKVLHFNNGITPKVTVSKRNETILYIAICSLIALLPLALELWKYINSSRFEWNFVIRWWSGMVPLIIIFILHNHILIPKFIKRGRLKLYVLFVVLSLLSYGGFKYISDRMRHENIKEMSPHKHHPEHEEHTKRPPRPFPLHLILDIMLATMTIGMNTAISLAITYYREQAGRKELENKRLQEELKYLRQQISPHFLMNVLNNIHEMTEENIKEAQDMILELSYLMRYVLYESENQTTTLTSESRFISSYVALMRRRYVEGTVSIRLDIEEKNTEDIAIPPLLFVSFIENAFKHGISYSAESVIDIKLSADNGKIFFSCANSIPQNKNNGMTGGVGLANVKRRLDLLYGQDYSLRIKQENNLYSVILIIPSHDKMHDNR